MPFRPLDPLCEKTPTSPFAIGSAIVVLLFAVVNLARILSVAADHGETPFLSANDRSRWSAIAALLEDRSFAIDRFLEKRDSKGKTRTWYSIDMVRHRDDQGVERYYSSKPPLLTVVYAAATWPAMVGFQKRLSEYPLLIGRASLVIINLLPMLIFVLWWRRTVSALVQGDWAKWLLWIAGLFGTFLVTFTVTLNNHLHAAICMVISMVLLQRILNHRLKVDSDASGLPSHGSEARVAMKRAAETTTVSSSTMTSQGAGAAMPLRWQLIALGLIAGCAVMCDLPALAWAGLLPWIIFTRARWIHDWLYYSAGLFPMLAAIVGVNWYAHGDWRPPYYHRENLGDLITTVSASQVLTPEANNNLHALTPQQLAALSAQFDQASIRDTLGIQSPIQVDLARRNATLSLRGKDSKEPTIERRFAITLAQNQWSIHQWNDWYDYPRSYWLPGNKRGVDLGEPSRLVYAWNCLFGHHGIFSLTPIFLLSILGAIIAIRMENPSTRRLALGIVITSIVCIVFYLSRNQLDRNYGGVCSGFRWQFWLIPSWLWLACHAYHSASGSWSNRGWCQRIVELACGISIFSAWYPAANPWQHPWIYQIYLSMWN